MNSTETYWDVDGVSLQTYAWNIVTLGGERSSARRLRGSDVLVPFRPGDMWVEKQVEAHVISLGMWVQGSNEDGTIPTDVDLRRQYDQNWRALRRLLFRRRKTYTLTKRFWIREDELVAAGVDPDTMPRSGTGANTFRLMTASAQASYAGELVPTMQGQAHASFTVDIKIHGSYFYSAPVTIPTFNMSGTTDRDVTILGDDLTTRIDATLTGPLTGARIENTTDDVWFQYDSAILSGETVQIDVHDFGSLHNAATPYLSAGNVSHSGDAFWLFLDPDSGETSLQLTAQGGSGSVQISYRPAWF